MLADDFFELAGRFPKQGMKNARIIGTISYRSGPEWEQRFSNERVDPASPLSLPHQKGFAPDFHVESYLQHQSDSFSTRYDPNSLVRIIYRCGLLALPNLSCSFVSPLPFLGCRYVSDVTKRAIALCKVTSNFGTARFRFCFAGLR